MNKFLVFGCLGVMAIIFLVMGILIRFGYLRTAYAVKGNPVFAPPAFVPVLVFGGLLAGSFAIVPFIPQENRFAFGLYFIGPLWILTLILAIWQPWWLKPKWLRWLEKEHGDIIEILWEEVRQEGHAWERRVRTQEELEEWVEEVRRKHGL